jgi:hypothetical protein
MEVSKQETKNVEHILTDYSCKFFKIGKTTVDQSIKINNVICVPISKAKKTWENGLRDKLL